MCVCVNLLQMRVYVLLCCLSLLTMSAAVRNIRQETGLLVILRARQFTHVTEAHEPLPPLPAVAAAPCVINITYGRLYTRYSDLYSQPPATSRLGGRVSTTAALTVRMPRLGPDKTTDKPREDLLLTP